MMANQDLCFYVQLFHDSNALSLIVMVNYCELTAPMVTCRNQLFEDGLCPRTSDSKMGFALSEKALGHSLIMFSVLLPLTWLNSPEKQRKEKEN